MSPCYCTYRQTSLGEKTWQPQFTNSKWRVGSPVCMVGLGSCIPSWVCTGLSLWKVWRGSGGIMSQGGMALENTGWRVQTCCWSKTGCVGEMLARTLRQVFPAVNNLFRA